MEYSKAEFDRVFYELYISKVLTSDEEWQRGTPQKSVPIIRSSNLK